MNRLIISGFVASDPITNYTSNGNAVVHFSLSVRKGKRREDGTYAANFFQVDAFNRTADLIKERNLLRGDFVSVEGRLDNDVYEQAGKKQTRTKIIAEYVELPPASAADKESAAPKDEAAESQENRTVQQESGAQKATNTPSEGLTRAGAPAMDRFAQEYGAAEDEIPF